MRRHYVTFQWPGTFVAETTTKPIEVWDSCEAVRLAGSVVERHGTRPYCFSFTTCVEGKVIVEGIELAARKEVESSGNYFLGGSIRSWEEIAPRHEVLRDNMRCNDWPLVVVIGGDDPERARAVRPFVERDMLVNPETGQLACRGDDAELRAWRASVRAIWAAAGWNRG